MKTLSTKFITAAILATVVTTNAFADTWCHGFLTAKDGTEIQIDYQVGQEYSPLDRQRYATMENIHIRAKNPDFSSHERVFIHFTTADNVTGADWGNAALDAAYDGVRYTTFLKKYDSPTSSVPFTSLIRPVGVKAHIASLYHLEFAIAVNSNWLVDPVTNYSTFKFFADQYQNLCASPN